MSQFWDYLYNGETVMADQATSNMAQDEAPASTAPQTTPATTSSDEGIPEMPRPLKRNPKVVKNPPKQHPEAPAKAAPAAKAEAETPVERAVESILDDPKDTERVRSAVKTLRRGELHRLLTLMEQDEAIAAFAKADSSHKLHRKACHVIASAIAAHLNERYVDKAIIGGEHAAYASTGPLGVLGLEVGYRHTRESNGRKMTTHKGFVFGITGCGACDLPVEDGSQWAKKAAEAAERAKAAANA